MKTLFFSILSIGWLGFAAIVVGADFDQAKAEAEKFYREGSYARAYRAYSEFEPDSLTPEQARWVLFRRADMKWRSQAATRTADNTVFQEAQKELQVLIRDIERSEQRDLVWAEVQESLGDFHWRRQQRNWGQAWQHYRQALEWWAGSTEIERARERYIGLIEAMTGNPDRNRFYHYGYYGNHLPLDVVENYLGIADTPKRRAHAHYLVAMTLRNRGGDWRLMQRVPDAFEQAIALGRGTDWMDDALYQYAEWMGSRGRVTLNEQGGWNSRPDYVRAVELYRRLVKEFNKGETRYYDNARQRIRQITGTDLNAQVSHVFLPDSEIQFQLRWRNIKRVELVLYEIDLSAHAGLPAGEDRQPSFLQSVEVDGRPKVREWSHETGDQGEHRPGSDTIQLDEKLEPGAYLLVARGGGEESRELVLVSDAALVFKTSGTRALVYMCDVNTGAPIPEATVTLSQRYRENRNWRAEKETQQADEQGIAVFELIDEARRGELFVGARKGKRQAFGESRFYTHGSNRSGQWKIYAFTDRPAYRPGEKVQWKFTARQYDGETYSTPANETLHYRINGPDGSLVKEAPVKLNAFGSAWGEVELSDELRLGEYRISFLTVDKQQNIGNARLFRLEEYKLPEFKVSVEMPEDDDGRKRLFRVGDTVEAKVKAEYYFGGPVPNAKVEVLIRQKPYHHYIPLPREFPWFFEDMDRLARFRHFGNGSIVKRETLTTDADGTVTVSWDTPNDTGQSFEYSIEARVTDSSRREIVGSESVRVTREPYYVDLRTSHHLYRPRDEVEVKVRAQDANEQPIEVRGEVRIWRQVWREIWVAPDGREVQGDELREIRGRSGIFPPEPEPGQRPWRRKFHGYEKEEILTRAVKTGDQGEGSLSFRPEREGYYSIQWKSPANPDGEETPEPPVTAQTTVWVTTPETTDLGYRQDGVEIIVDKDSFRVGEKAPVMLVVPASDRYVLFGVEGEDLYEHRLVHVTGTVKLVQLDIGERHVPNFFLSAASVSDRQVHMDQKQVVVPPIKNFLTVEVEADKEQYGPREEGRLTITTRDDEGKPVPAEVSLGLVDESIYYIQSDYAGDPRKFYFGDKRSHRVNTRSTFNEKSYIRWVELEEEKKRLVDERDLARLGERVEGESGAFPPDETAKSEVFRMQQRGSTKDLAEPNPLSAPRTAAPAMKAASADATVAGAEMQLAAEAVGGGAGAEPAVQVRTDFRSTVVWKPDVTTGKNGRATVKVKYPDSLTGWKATARAVSQGNQFGIAEAATRTKLPLIVRLQAPRFFVVGDKVFVSAVINNNTASNITVGATLEVGGLKIEGYVQPEAKENSVKIEGFPVMPYPTGTPRAGVGVVGIEANSEKRVDWLVSAPKAGPVKVKVSAIENQGALSDGMEKEFLAFEHGVEKFVAHSGKVRGKNVAVKLELPAARREGSTRMVVQVAPSLAVTMLDALPYLIDYPYGCTEQTMSRFLPAAITAKTLRDLDLKPELVMGRVFGGIEQEHVGKTQPDGKTDLAKLDEITGASLKRLDDFQHADGGWGWWKQGSSDHFMTAYVVWGLSLAKEAGVAVNDNVLRRAVKYLDRELVEEERRFDNQAWLLHALSESGRVAGGGRAVPSEFQAKAFENLWKNRDELNAYTRALLALSAHNYQYADKARILVRNLENGVKKDERPDRSVLVEDTAASSKSQQAAVMATAHWGEDGIYHRWSSGGVEATAIALRALLRIAPEHELIEPVTNWLIKNRRGARWSNTRDTAIVVLALNDYLRASGELEAGIDYVIAVNGNRVAKETLTGEEVFRKPARYEIKPEWLKDGENRIVVKRKKGDSPLYFAVQAEYFSLEEPVPPAGEEIFVKREYYKLVGKPTLLKGHIFEKEILGDGDTVRSGDRVEVVLTIETKNHLEYLVFEDLKPAGLEAVEIRSGESLYTRELKSGAVDRRFGRMNSGKSGRPALVAQAKPAGGSAAVAGLVASPAIAARPGIILPPPIPGPGDNADDYTGRRNPIHQELRDRKVALFIDKLPEGVWEIRYEMRAEVPGHFHALPVLGHAMYVPEIRCNGAEIRMTVRD